GHRRAAQPRGDCRPRGSRGPRHFRQAGRRARTGPARGARRAHPRRARQMARGHRYRRQSRELIRLRSQNTEDHVVYAAPLDSLRRSRQRDRRNTETLMSKLRLTFACGPYDRTLALRDGTIAPEGIELNYIASQPPDIFWRMLQFKEFEISEMSLS